MAYRMAHSVACSMTYSLQHAYYGLHSLWLLSWRMGLLHGLWPTAWCMADSMAYGLQHGLWPVAYQMAYGPTAWAMGLQHGTWA